MTQTLFIVCCFRLFKFLSTNHVHFVVPVHFVAQKGGARQRVPQLPSLQAANPAHSHFPRPVPQTQQATLSSFWFALWGENPKQAHRRWLSQQPCWHHLGVTGSFPGAPTSLELDCQVTAHCSPLSPRQWCCQDVWKGSFSFNDASLRC